MDDQRFATEAIKDSWDEIPAADFDVLDAALLYELIKDKTAFALHRAIMLGRDDVVLLFLLEFDMQLTAKINELDDNGHSPLHLALLNKHESIGDTLLVHGANVNGEWGDNNMLLLHAAIDRGDSFAACFLIKNQANVDAVAAGKLAPIHLAAIHALPDVVNLLFEYGARVNVTDDDGNSALQAAILAGQESIVDTLLANQQIDTNIRNNAGHTALWLALDLPELRIAGILVDRGSDINLTTVSGDSLLHNVIKNENEDGAIFLLDRGAIHNSTNDRREMPLHLVCTAGLHTVLDRLVELKAPLNCQNKELQTPLMLAIIAMHPEIIETLLRHRLEINMVDHIGQCALGLAVEAGDLQIATKLLAVGADIDATAPNGYTLLHKAIERQDEQGALFLLSKGANVMAKTDENMKPLQLAITHAVSGVIGTLCQMGADVNAPDDNGTTPLWLALSLKQEEVARTLVTHKCNLNELGEGGFTALHLAIKAEDEFSAIFLITHHAEVNTQCTQEQLAPIHLAADNGMDKVVHELFRHKAMVNIADSKRRTALHRAVEATQVAMVRRILTHPQADLRARDAEDMTAFGIAILAKNMEIAGIIKTKEPGAADQPNSQGLGLLHMCINKSDEESILLLMKCGVNVNAVVQDPTQKTPLSLAVERGLDSVVKLLLDNNADHRVPDRLSRWTAAHMAASLGFVGILNMLIAKGANMEAADDLGDTVLHAAVRSGQKEIVKTLMTKTSINLEVVNQRNETPLHTLAMYPKEGSVGTLQLLFPKVSNVNPQDIDGNTPLLSAYDNDAVVLCKAFVSNGAHVGIPNKKDQTIFNIKKRDNKMLLRLLNLIPREQPFIENKKCQESGSKFGTKNRRHHCRHCGRSLLKKHSSEKIVISKFAQPGGKKEKPMRVCDPCYLVLSGAADDVLKVKDTPKKKRQPPGGGGSPQRPPAQQQQQQQQQQQPPQMEGGSPQRTERRPQPGAMQREMEEEEARGRRQSGQSMQSTSSGGSAPGGRGASGAMPSWASNNAGGGGGGGDGEGGGGGGHSRNSSIGSGRGVGGGGHSRNNSNGGVPGSSPLQQQSQPANPFAAQGGGSDGRGAAPNNPFASSQMDGRGASGAMPSWANNAAPAAAAAPAEALPSWANGGAEGGGDTDSDDDL